MKNTLDCILHYFYDTSNGNLHLGLSLLLVFIKQQEVLDIPKNKP